MLVEWVLQPPRRGRRGLPSRTGVPRPGARRGLRLNFDWFAASADVFGFDPRRGPIGGMSAGGFSAWGCVAICRGRCNAAHVADARRSEQNRLSPADRRCRVIWDHTSNENCMDGVARRSPRHTHVSAQTRRRPARPTSQACRPPTSRRLAPRPPATRPLPSRVGSGRRVGSAELHVGAGGFHGFQTIVPTASVSQTAVQTRESWVPRCWRHNPGPPGHEHPPRPAIEPAVHQRRRLWLRFWAMRSSGCRGASVRDTNKAPRTRNISPPEPRAACVGPGRGIAHHR